MTARQAFAWTYGMASVQALGGMLGPVCFILPDGRQVCPLHVAPWFEDGDRATYPVILRELRGEWPCVPFGSDAPRRLPAGWSATGDSFAGADLPHGFGSNSEWTFTDVQEQSVTLICDYPPDHPVRRLTRRIEADPQAPRLIITLTVEVRRPCRLPIGLHPTLRVPALGQVRLVPPAFRQGWVFPIDVEPERGVLLPGATFETLAEVPCRSGGTLAMDRLPLGQNTEELLQLCGVTGGACLQHPEEGWQVRLDWDVNVFPSLLMWVSNRGRDHTPWSGRHLALGLEPICSAFDLGPALSTAANPILAGGTATSHDFHPEAPLVTRYSISAEPLAI